jgi:hypothetical protein
MTGSEPGGPSNDQHASTRPTLREYARSADRAACINEWLAADADPWSCYLLANRAVGLATGREPFGDASGVDARTAGLPAPLSAARSAQPTRVGGGADQPRFPTPIKPSARAYGKANG